MRWSPCSSLARPLSFAGASMGMASECSIGMAGLLSTWGTKSGTGVSIAGVGEDSCDGSGVGPGAEGGSVVTVGTRGPAAAHGRVVYCRSSSTVSVAGITNPSMVDNDKLCHGSLSVADFTTEQDSWICGLF
jgi:hypothetical protein